MEKVQDLKDKAASYRQEAHDSFERCDTDGFLSQWANGLHARKCDLQSEIENRGGKSEFPALFDLEGNLVCAKLIDGRYGNCWALMTENKEDNGYGYVFTGKFISAFPARQSTMEKKGYREGRVLAPAVAVITGKGTGLSGHAWAAIVRKDGGYSKDVEIIDNGLCTKVNRHRSGHRL